MWITAADARCPGPGTGRSWGKETCIPRCSLSRRAPGRNEDRDGIPFTGRSGELFDRLLGEIGMNREEIYLTNIVKCHPPGNRDPKPEEQETYPGEAG